MLCIRHVYKRVGDTWRGNLVVQGLVNLADAVTAKVSGEQPTVECLRICQVGSCFGSLPAGCSCMHRLWCWQGLCWVWVKPGEGTEAAVNVPLKGWLMYLSKHNVALFSTSKLPGSRANGACHDCVMVKLQGMPGTAAFGPVKGNYSHGAVAFCAMKHGADTRRSLSGCSPTVLDAFFTCCVVQSHCVAAYAWQSPAASTANSSMCTVRSPTSPALSAQRVVPSTSSASAWSHPAAPPPC